MLKRVTIAVAVCIGLVACDTSQDEELMQSQGANIVVSFDSKEYEARCKGLLGKSVGTGTIEEVELVETGDKLIPFIWRVFLWWNDLDVGEFRAPVNFCQVIAKLRPVTGSEITLKGWLPQQWNGKIFAGGGGGFNGDAMIAEAVDTKH